MPAKPPAKKRQALTAEDPIKYETVRQFYVRGADGVRGNLRQAVAAAEAAMGEPVSYETAKNWAQDGRWDLQKQALAMSPSTQTEVLWAEVLELNGLIAASVSEPARRGDYVKQRSDILKDIDMLDSSADPGMHLDVLQTFGNFISTQHQRYPEARKLFAALFREYSNEMMHQYAHGTFGKGGRA